MKIPSNIKAILWDMDGVIVDSEKYWHSKSDLFYHKFTPRMTSQDQHNITGKNNRDTYAYLKEHFTDDMKGVEYENYLEISSEFALSEIYPHCDLCEGVLPLLEGLHKSDLSMCICSSAIRPWVDYAVNRFDLGKYFTFTLSGNDINRGKPEPEVFLKAADTFGINPQDCLVIEDSHNGVKAGKAAGMLVWAYHTDINRQQDLSLADSHFSDFSTFLLNTQ